MSASAYIYYPDENIRRPFDEFAMVRAKRELREGDVRVPAGATGAIVQTYDDPDMFQVEFTEPLHAVIGVRAIDLEPM